MAPDFLKNVPNNFAEIIPDHPHRRMRILISILAFVLVAGSVTYYQINKVKVKEEVAVAPPASVVDPNSLTPEQREKIVTDLKEASKKLPPLTESQKMKAIEGLRESAKKMPVITDSERINLLAKLKQAESNIPH